MDYNYSSNPNLKPLFTDYTKDEALSYVANHLLEGAKLVSGGAFGSEVNAKILDGDEMISITDIIDQSTAKRIASNLYGVNTVDIANCMLVEAAYSSFYKPYIENFMKLVEGAELRLIETIPSTFSSYAIYNRAKQRGGALRNTFPPSVKWRMNYNGYTPDDCLLHPINSYMYAYATVTTDSMEYLENNAKYIGYETYNEIKNKLLSGQRVSISKKLLPSCKYSDIDRFIDILHRSF